MLPAGMRVYAIGDIHGRRDLLDRLLATIDADHEARGGGPREIIFLGDLLNRGADSSGVIERLMAMPAEETRFLRGNHEEVVCALWRGDNSLAPLFHKCDGRATLGSYGVSGEEYDRWDHDGLARGMREHIPERHIIFLESFAEQYRLGDYLFVHAGVRPGVPLDRQDARDLRWIREEFTRSPADHGAMVVHGHSIVPRAELHPNRIAIDTGAYRSGRLTALGLEAGQCWFLDSLEGAGLEGGGPEGGGPEGGGPEGDGA